MEPGSRTLEGKVAVVTGAALRIGKALAIALADRGASVAVHYGGSAGAAAETVAHIREGGGTAEPLQADLRRIPEAGRLIERAAERLGMVDILVNSAALYRVAEIADTSEELWDEQFAINLKAPFFLAKAFALHVGRERTGQIINIADWRGVRCDPGALAYSMTKAGVIAMTEGLALALGPNIRVNAIAPGAILPPAGKDESYLEEIGKGSPLGRHGSTDDMVRALLYLAAAEYVTGQVLFVDGGEHLGRDH